MLQEWAVKEDGGTAIFLGLLKLPGKAAASSFLPPHPCLPVSQLGQETAEEEVVGQLLSLRNWPEADTVLPLRSQSTVKCMAGCSLVQQPVLATAQREKAPEKTRLGVFG